jgi:hypothetical protein
MIMCVTGILGQRPSSRGSNMSGMTTHPNMPNKERVVVTNREKKFTTWHEHTTGRDKVAI